MVTVSAAKGLLRTPVIGYAPPGSEELAELVMECFRDAAVKVALLRNHGVISVAKDLFEALYQAEVAEDTAKIATLADRLGTPLQFE